jgi:hypothetical protein
VPVILATQELIKRMATPGKVQKTPSQLVKVGCGACDPSYSGNINERISVQKP